METNLFLILLAVPALAGLLLLPWLMVRQGYREIVGMYCFITSVLTVSLVAGVIGQSGDYSLMLIFAAAAFYGVLLVISSALPLWLTRAKRQ